MWPRAVFRPALDSRLLTQNIKRWRQTMCSDEHCMIQMKAKNKEEKIRIKSFSCFCLWWECWREIGTYSARGGTRSQPSGIHSSPYFSMFLSPFINKFPSLTFDNWWYLGFENICPQLIQHYYTEISFSRGKSQRPPINTKAGKWAFEDYAHHALTTELHPRHK